MTRSNAPGRSRCDDARLLGLACVSDTEGVERMPGPDRLRSVRWLALVATWSSPAEVKKSGSRVPGPDCPP